MTNHKEQGIDALYQHHEYDDEARDWWQQWAAQLETRIASRHYRLTSVPDTGGRRRMVWKMRIDLSRPLVDTMGQHDPLDGLVTLIETIEGFWLVPANRNSATLRAHQDINIVILTTSLAPEGCLAL